MESLFPHNHISYQLHIHVFDTVNVRIGALGQCRFPAGRYIYTGSARRNLEQRILRHLRKQKKLRWHIDYLLSHPAVLITQVTTSDEAECQWNQRLHGSIIIRGFGASDCKKRCGSHLLRLNGCK